MTSRIETNLDFIKAVGDKNSKKRQNLIKSASEDNILSLVEIAHNTLKGKLPLDESTEKKLNRHRRSIRQLANTKGSIKTKKNILIKKGGFLPLLVPPVLYLIGSCIGKTALGILEEL